MTDLNLKNLTTTKNRNPGKERERGEIEEKKSRKRGRKKATREKEMVALNTPRFFYLLLFRLAENFES